MIQILDSRTTLCLRRHSCQFYLGWFVRICRSYFERECKYSAPVEALQKHTHYTVALVPVGILRGGYYLIWVDDELEVEQVVHVRELRLACLRKLQLIQVLKIQYILVYLCWMSSLECSFQNEIFSTLVILSCAALALFLVEAPRFPSSFFSAFEKLK